jgi:heat shock protein HslJ
MAEHPQRVALIVLPIVVAIGLAVGLAFNATGDAGDDGRDQPDSLVDPVDVQLAGQTFVSTSVEGRTLVPDTTIRLSFDADVLSVNAGCNTMAGAWTDADSTLAWEGAVRATLKGCAEDLSAQDQWITDLFTGGMDISSDDADLTLESGEVTIEFENAGDAPSD